MPHYATYWKDAYVALKVGKVIEYIGIQSAAGAFRLISAILVGVVLDQKDIEQPYPSEPLYDPTFYAYAKTGAGGRGYSIPIDYFAGPLSSIGLAPSSFKRATDSPLPPPESPR